MHKLLVRGAGVLLYRYGVHGVHACTCVFYADVIPTPHYYHNYHAGITLSPKQVERGTALAKQRGLDNCEFRVMDALNMTFEEDNFDLVWGCESGEHMPDKQRYYSL